MNATFGPARTAPWRDSEEIECVMVVPEAPNVATFVFRAPSGAWFDYLPGQFLTLEIPAESGTVWRTYTISSSPSRPLSISITAKAQPNTSIGTRWMLDNLAPGVRLKAVGPGGLFSTAHHPSPKYLFISAGSGVTPMYSMSTFLWDQGTEPDIVFINAAKRPSEIIFREQLEHMATRVPGFVVRFVVEEPDRWRAWTGYRGFFNQLMLGLMAPDYLEREVFCCGPEPFMQAVRDMLNALGYDMSRYHQESFQAPIETDGDSPLLDDVVPDADTSAEITFSASGKTVSCAQTDTVLAVARASGLNIPSGCTFGLCGTCKIMKTEGEVHMVHNGGISDEDIEEGYILACCSNPIGKVVVEV
ncbi:hybrid-cluster NAD(P)-dependent oxidoreductase [Falsirhodobacter xinxiangensis]|uniref:hybrid-cluster NAD(P)-dependent oxidoreductase n=1 Tax=Falsirhodobacter xinxiangensis TaxID=2530049 RepID=UPI0010AA26B3|nr:hybrid-cluster NAD(P)-dependent oxidoreductase [Rhodobacter xinxiangensis]